MSSERVWVEDRSWRTPSAYGRCRFRAAYQPCPNPPAADVRRRAGKGERWWAYCATHAYGRRILPDRVMVQVAADSPAALRGWAD